MKQKLVSIVVPIYNTERYLDRCIDSIVNQTYRNLEILLIDDGSPDRCPQMCDEWAKKDSRIYVIHKHNEGLAMARNTGIDHATGDYICFFDSDDYVDSHTIERAVGNAETYHSDIVCYGMYRVNSQGKVTASFVPCPDKYFYEKDSIRNEFLIGLTGSDRKTGKNWNISMSACSKLFSLDMIRKAGWNFVSEKEIISEDFYSLLEFYSYAERISVIPEALYYYCENSMSTTHLYRPDRFEKVCHFYREVVKLCETLVYRQEVLDNLAGVYLSFVITAMKQENGSQRTQLEKWTSIKAMVDNELLQSVLEKRKELRVGWKKDILFWSMRKKAYLLCDLLLTAQNAFGK